MQYMNKKVQLQYSIVCVYIFIYFYFSENRWHAHTKLKIIYNTFIVHFKNIKYVTYKKFVYLILSLREKI